MCKKQNQNKEDNQNKITKKNQKKNVLIEEIIFMKIFLSIKFLLREKYNKFKVYFHNFSHFDSAFFINVLSDLSDYPLNPIIRNDDIINFKYYYGKGYYITFKDSLLLLPAKLSLLAKSFGFEDKGIFPYNFINNKNIKMDYIGKFPRFKFLIENKFIIQMNIMIIKLNILNIKKCL
jgi:DNA polymerase type B, organellar and viral